MTTTPETNAPDPAEFDFEAWIQDAKLPEASCTVYKRGDLVAQIDDLARQIKIETDALRGEMVSGGSPALSSLIKEREKLLKAFAASEMTFYLRALPSAKLVEIARAHETPTDATKEVRMQKQVELNRELLAASVIGLASPRLARRDLDMTPALVAALEQKIGAAQLTQLMLTRQSVQNDAPRPDADFLPGPSGTSQS
ncbi:hypothetical protein [Glutamicibacter sp. PS]|uniref:hypothetical protein n=1 Tax=Glutamicibacter sp. PS TaxID=3075634 RepID=UPI0028427704|nr:hypothetical protein [Glutamicibacter sp. PS]MDR4533210.1 hypothetical protein [Glutamicibacter sp. PS]